MLAFLSCLVSSETAPKLSAGSICDDSTLLQTAARALVPTSSTSSTSSSSQSTASPTTSIVPSDFRPPNAEMRATLAGLNFALAQSKDFVAKKIIEAPLIPGHTVTVSMQAVSTLDFSAQAAVKKGGVPIKYYTIITNYLYSSGAPINE